MRYLSDPNPAKAQSVMQAMLKMSKIEIAVFTAGLRARLNFSPQRTRRTQSFTSKHVVSFILWSLNTQFHIQIFIKNGSIRQNYPRRRSHRLGPCRKSLGILDSPQHITQWNQASDDWHCPSADNDLRVGGSFSSKMAARDGSFEFDFEGIYDEVDCTKKSPTCSATTAKCPLRSPPTAIRRTSWKRSRLKTSTPTMQVAGWAGYSEQF